MNAAVLLLLLAAPAPPARPAPPPPPPPAVRAGAWVMTWHGGDYETHLHGDGLFTCFYGGRWWRGRWSQAAGVLAVEESPWDDGSHVVRWSVKLRCPASGVMPGGTPWRLVPLAGRIRP